MLGGMLAGHDESGGELIKKTKKFRLFYGMNKTAMDKHMRNMLQNTEFEGKLKSEKYKGSSFETKKDILGGVRSTCTYVGASQLKELSKRTTLYECIHKMPTKSFEIILNFKKPINSFLS
jgi:GMP reductase